jgi:GWxTD domain-containing protein
MTINYDVLDEKMNLVKRVSDEFNVSVEDYDQTNSNLSFIEGVTAISLNEGNYSIVPSVNLLYADKDVILKKFDIVIPNLDEYIFGKPIVIESNLTNCDYFNDLFRLANFEGVLPFSSENYSILIPINTTEVEDLTVNIIQNGKSFEQNDYSLIYNEELNFRNCSNKIIISKNKSDNHHYIILKDVNQMIDEDEFEIQVKSDKEEKKFDLKSVWINKPRSLRNVKEAILILFDYFDEKVVDEIYRADSDSLYYSLKKFWKKMDKTSNTTFNEVMSEFYSRIDFAIDNFSSINKFDGAKTDRGKVFIKYGEPSSNERVFSNNKVVEIWEYEQLEKKFIFTDNTGTGNFILEK